MTVSTSPPAASTGDGDRFVGLADGVELVGEFAGSGYREPPRLVYRSDGQVVRLSALLYLVVEAFDRRRDDDGPVDQAAVLSAAAGDLTRTTGRDFTGEHVAYLCDRKLAPLGVTTYSDGSPPEVARANPFLALRFRVAVLPERATWLLGGALMWLFRPAAIVVMLLAAGVGEVWAFGTQHPATALEQTIMTPTGILAVLGLMLASTAFHEIGHATACRYGGVRPGAMGCGIYLVWPAFYTDITNTYRLGRAGRLRADLGGVYFNAVFLIAMSLLYATTGYQPLLVAVLMINIEIIQQLLPTLRFDGYYIVADLVGIPDLFTYIGAILKRTVLRRAPDDRLKSLKRWPQTIVTAWVLVVIPVLLLQLGYLVSRLPYLIGTDVDTIRGLVAEAVGAPDPVLAIASASVQVLLLALPVAGVAVILTQFARTGARLLARRFRGRSRSGTPHRAARPRLRTGAVAFAAVIVAAGAAWTLTTGLTPDPSPMAAPTQAPITRNGTPPPSAHPSHEARGDPQPNRHTSPAQPPPKPDGTGRTPAGHGHAPAHHTSTAPRTGEHGHAPSSGAGHAPAQTRAPQQPSTHRPPSTPAPHQSARPAPTPKPTHTCKIQLPILPIGIGCR
jgi:putative peptide zinc metalloprotease protein